MIMGYVKRRGGSEWTLFATALILVAITGPNLIRKPAHPEIAAEPVIGM
jgi:hypothetical protein